MTFWKNFKILFRHSRFVFKFHGIIRREVVETMRCFVDKNLTKSAFFGQFCTRLAEGAKSLLGSVPRDYTSPCKISYKSVPFLPELFPKK